MNFVSHYKYKTISVTIELREIVVWVLLMAGGLDDIVKDDNDDDNNNMMMMTWTFLATCANTINTIPTTTKQIQFTDIHTYIVYKY